MKCLNCGEDFQEKRPTAKFCSTSCRVMYNRKYGKKNPITKSQLQVLYQTMLDTLANAGNVNLNAEIKSMRPIQEEPLSFDKLRQQVAQKQTKPPKTMNQYFEGKRECGCQEDFEAWLAEVDADPYLSSKQKQILKTQNPSGL